MRSLWARAGMLLRTNTHRERMQSFQVTGGLASHTADMSGSPKLRLSREEQKIGIVLSEVKPEWGRARRTFMYGYQSCQISASSADVMCNGCGPIMVEGSFGG